MKKKTVTHVTYDGFVVTYEARKNTVSNGKETFSVGFFSDREASDLIKMMEKGVSFGAGIEEIRRRQTQENIPMSTMEMIREGFVSRWMFGKNIRR